MINGRLFDLYPQLAGIALVAISCWVANKSMTVNVAMPGDPAGELVNLTSLYFVIYFILGVSMVVFGVAGFIGSRRHNHCVLGMVTNFI